jgi:hypothetical protein
MEQITAIYQWVLANSGTIVTTATAVVAAASTIAALTPTPKDDGLVKKAYMLIDWFALNVGKAKDTGEAPTTKKAAPKKKPAKK